MIALAENTIPKIDRAILKVGANWVSRFDITVAYKLIFEFEKDLKAQFAARVALLGQATGCPAH